MNTRPPRSPTADARRDERLRRDITFVLAIKLVAIVLLWLVFVHPHGVTVDSHRAGHSLLGTPPSTVPAPEPTP